MDIRLRSIKIRNFKKHKNLVFSPDCRDASIYGDNKLGKTTIYDAFCWLLFNKDGRGRTDFTIKPTGAIRPEVEVEAVLVIDGREWTFKKVLTENWTKKRGTGEEAFSGHTTKYYLNDLETTLGDYKARLDSFVSEDTFKRLTSASYLLAMKKPELRRLLVTMAGDVDDSVIVGNDKDLAELVAWMASKSYTVDDALKLAKQNLSLYNAENDALSIRIDETTRSKPKEPEGGWTKVEQGILVARKELEKIDLKIASLNMAKVEAKKTAGEIESLEMEIRAMRLSMLEAANEDKAKAKRNLEAIKEHIRLTEQKAQAIIWQQDLAKNNLETLEKQVKAKQDEYTRLKAEKRELFETVFVPIEAGALSCDKCGQTLPETAIEEMNGIQLERWSASKEAELTRMDTRLNNASEQGQSLVKMLEAAKAKEAEQTAELERLQHELSVAELAVVDAQSIYDGLIPASDVDLSADPEYQAKLKRIETLKQQLIAPEDNLNEILAYKARVEKATEAFRSILQGKADIERADQRIAELMEQGKRLAGQIAVERKNQSLCESFIRRKAELLSDKINSMFTDVSFRLFDQQINGGIADDCTPMVRTENGFVELGLNASNSEQINAGLDIVNALQKHEDITVPVFIDNCEAVTKPKAMNCQVIKLVVSETDPALRFVVQEAKEVVPKQTQTAQTVETLEQINFDEFFK